MADFDKVKALAAELSAGFEDVLDRDGKPFDRDRIMVRSLNDATRERFQDVCYKAHGDMFPDDWRYSMIEEAAGMLADSDDEESYRNRVFESEAPVYNADLLGYIASHGARFNGYADDAISEYDPKEFTQICGLAWHIEFREVADLLLEALGDMADDEPEAAEG